MNFKLIANATTDAYLHHFSAGIMVICGDDAPELFLSMIDLYEIQWIVWDRFIKMYHF